MSTRTAVLLSGGVDSSVALMRLVNGEVDGCRGRHDLTAFYIRIWLEDELAFLGRCPWEEDLTLARAVCEQAGVRFEIVSLQREYRDRVVHYALEELRRGRTPSSDVLCNRRIKFGAFLSEIGPGFDRVASGHYARVTRKPDGARLLCSADPVKDQTYFLCRLTPEQVARCTFPVGDLEKSHVRELARAWNLPTATRPDSQGICFLGRVPYDAFVRHHLGDQPGPIVEAGTGRVLGTHRGIWFHTIGQRRGLGLSGGPWFVVAKQVETRMVEVVHAGKLKVYARRTFRVEDVNWIGPETAAGRLQVKIRHGEHREWAEVRPAPDGTLEVHLEQPEAGIAPGQFAVFYDSETCLGGGPIADEPATG